MKSRLFISGYKGFSLSTQTLGNDWVEIDAAKWNFKQVLKFFQYTLYQEDNHRIVTMYKKLNDLELIPFVKEHFGLKGNNLFTLQRIWSGVNHKTTRTKVSRNDEMTKKEFKEILSSHKRIVKALDDHIINLRNHDNKFLFNFYKLLGRRAYERVMVAKEVKDMVVNLEEIEKRLLLEDRYLWDSRECSMNLLFRWFLGLSVDEFVMKKEKEFFTYKELQLKNQVEHVTSKTSLDILKTFNDKEGVTMENMSVKVANDKLESELRNQKKEEERLEIDIEKILKVIDDLENQLLLRETEMIIEGMDVDDTKTLELDGIYKEINVEFKEKLAEIKELKRKLGNNSKDSVQRISLVNTMKGWNYSNKEKLDEFASDTRRKEIGDIVVGILSKTSKRLKVTILVRLIKVPSPILEPVLVIGNVAMVWKNARWEIHGTVYMENSEYIAHFDLNTKDLSEDDIGNVVKIAEEYVSCNLTKESELKNSWRNVIEALKWKNYSDDKKFCNVVIEYLDEIVNLKDFESPRMFKPSDNLICDVPKVFEEFRREEDDKYACIFTTHEDLDNLCSKIMEKEPMFDINHPESYRFLMGLDKAFWNNYETTKEKKYEKGKQCPFEYYYA